MSLLLQKIMGSLYNMGNLTAVKEVLEGVGWGIHEGVVEGRRGGGAPDSWFPMGIPQSEGWVLEKQKLKRGTTISFCGCGLHDSKTTIDQYW